MSKLKQAIFLVWCMVVAGGAGGPVFAAPQTEGQSEMKKIDVESTLAGAWYTADPVQLHNELTDYLRAAGDEGDESAFGVIVPHAGYTFSGATAAAGIQWLRGNTSFNRVVVLGFTHRVRLPHRASLPLLATHYRTPLGEVPLDVHAMAQLAELHPFFTDVPATRDQENSVEMQIPLLQVALKDRDWTLLPITLGQLDAATRKEMADALRPLMDERTVWVVSSDFTHYGEGYGYVPFTKNVEENIRQLDQGAITRILAGDAAAFAAYCEQTGATICGQDSIGVFLNLLPKHFSARELDYDTSGAQTGEFNHSVSYASIGFSKNAAAKNSGADESAAKADDALPVLTPEDKQALLALARQSIESALKGGRAAPPEPASPGMKAVMGGFVTLTIDGELRGCIGEIMPRRPLFRVVWDRARDAAFEDTRFMPLTAAEWPFVKIEISALTPPKPVASWKDIEIGRHGMTLEQNGRMAVFLPQVAPEQGWTLEETLTHLSMKAGLPSDAWQSPATHFEVFEAIVFHE